MSEDVKITDRAVSIYGQDDESLNDFPVLKAFQQYIDAEQTKARKRMILLCCFFGFIMLVVMTVFIVVLFNVNARNQVLSDKLFDLAMQKSEQQPALEKFSTDMARQISTQQANNDSAFKALTETLTALQTQIVAQQDKSEKLAEQISRKPEGATREQLALQHRLDEDTEKLRKAKALLQAEQDKVAAEKERLRKQEIEFQRRRLYPEYYAEQDRKAAAAKELEDEELDDIDEPLPPPKAKPAVKRPAKASRPAKPAAVKKAAAPSGPINYFEAYENDETLDDEMTDEELQSMVKALPVRKPAAKTTSPKPAQAKPKAKSAPEAKADHFGVPVEVNGTTTDWLVPTK